MVWVADAAQIPHCCDSGVGRAATALIGPLAWEPPYAAGVAQEMAKKKKKNLLGILVGNAFNIYVSF